MAARSELASILRDALRSPSGDRNALRMRTEQAGRKQKHGGDDDEIDWTSNNNGMRAAGGHIARC
jgi:hypothetical protein